MRFWRVAVIYLCVSHFAFANQVLEEVLAVVDSTPILHSDIELAGLVSLVERGPDTTIDAHRSRLLDARIRLELQYRDLEESGTLYRLDIDLERALDTLIARAGNEQELRAQFEKHGLAWADLEVVPAERAFVARLVDRLGLSAEEQRHVKAWLDSPPDEDELDPHQIPVEHRETFIEAVRGVIRVDGEVSPEEEESLELLSELLGWELPEEDAAAS